jgi:minor histocompatibility antigen H13
MASEPSPLANMLGRAAAHFYDIQPMIPTYVLLLASTVSIIYIGSHGSLSRPSSADPPKKAAIDSNDADEDEPEDTVQKMEAMMPSDIILFPILAGVTLCGLYFILKWLDDPVLLSKILNGWFAFFAIFAVGQFVTGALQVSHAFFFPKRYVRDGKLYTVNGHMRRVEVQKNGVPNEIHQLSPLPGFLSRLPLPQAIRTRLWDIRQHPAAKWTLKLYVHKLATVNTRFNAYHVYGLIASIVSVAYFNLVAKPWYLTNLMGLAFTYGALTQMSPSTFTIGSLLLIALFFYDIYFVFYT